jgi:uncharacterized membrane protein YbhN (UPF0104 family)
MASSFTEPTSHIPSWIKKVIPILVSVSILYYYFHNQDWRELVTAVYSAHLYLAVLTIIIPQLIFWYFDVLIVQRLIVWFHCPFNFKTFFLIRGSIYLLTMVHPILGGGGVILYLWRNIRITWTKLLGIMLFRYGLTLWGMVLLLIPTTIAIHRYELSERVRLNMWLWWGLLLFGFVWLVEAWLCWHYKKCYGLSKILAPNPEKEFWTAFHTATKKQWLLTWVMSIPPIILYLIGIYFLSRAFNVNVPFLEFMVVAPLTMAIAEMPIAFAGFGTTTLAFFSFFAKYGSSEAIAALTLFLPFVRAVFRALVGLSCLRPALQHSGLLSKKSL